MNELAQPASASEAHALPSASGKRKRPLILRAEKVSKEQLKDIERLQAKDGIQFEEAAARLGLADDDDINAILVGQVPYPAIDINNTRLARCLTTAFRPQSPAAEALRSLRSELLLRFFGVSDQNVLALVGTDEARGIAYTAANLAISFAQAGSRTLLVDANLRESQLHGWFGLADGTPGLSDLLGRRSRVQPTHVAELGPLWVLPAGTQAPNPQELLSGYQYADILTPLYERFDVVLISTSPMNGSRDAQIIVAHTGAALLVTRENRTRVEDVKSLCEKLRGLDVQLLGAVLHQ